MSGAEKRQKLFEVNSAGLVTLGRGEPDTFVCPLCMMTFTQDALSGPEPKLTLAHIIPDALGGTLCTLACKGCNNGVGRSLEAALKQRFLFEDAVGGIGTLSARLAGDFGDVGVQVCFPGGEPPWQLEVVPKSSNPASTVALEQLLGGGEVDRSDALGCKLQFKHRDEPGAVGAALYQSAYLLIFHYFGYKFAFSPLAGQMREQFREPEKDILPRRFTIPPDDWVEANVAPRRGHAVVLLTEPYRGILVVMRFQPVGGLPRVIGVPLVDLDGKTWPVSPIEHVRGSIVRKHDNGEGLPPWVPPRHPAQ